MYRALKSLALRFKRRHTPDPSWTDADEAALREARAHHERRSALLKRKSDAVHADLARHVWGSHATGWRSGSMGR